mmetsp:Transcript_4101/g.25835  ORF Transcript_4101/g.25835 Transcript_4101/m.25835 type:complete len:172 (+) Transcript_4101:2468-2983(+)
MVRNLLGLFLHFVHAAPNEPLDRVEGVFRIDHSLSLGNLSNEAIAVFVESHDGWGSPLSFSIGDDGRFSSFHRCHRGVGGTQVNADHLFASDIHATPGLGKGCASPGTGAYGDACSAACEAAGARSAPHVRSSGHRTRSLGGRMHGHRLLVLSDAFAVREKARTSRASFAK